MPESKPVHFGLVAIHIQHFEEITRRLPTTDRKEASLTYVPQFGLGFDEAAQRIRIGIRMDVYLSNAEADTPSDEFAEVETPDEAHRVARIEVGCDFHLESLDDVRDEHRSVCVPRLFLAHLIGLSLSAVRGALAGRTHHPIFQRAPLPIQSPRDFIDQLVDTSEVDWIESTPAKS